MVDLRYRVARLQGKIIRRFYQVMLPAIASRPISQNRNIPIAVYSFSGTRDIPEQVISIRSFLRCVGIPSKFTVVSDGSHEKEERQLLESIHPRVRVADWKKLLKKDFPTSVYNYADRHPLGKKIAVLMSIPVEGVTLYADSDILFFPGARELVTLANLEARNAYSLPDCAAAWDERMLREEEGKFSPVNSGLILLKTPVDWSGAIARLSELSEPPNYFSEQTMVHLTLHANGAIPFDPERYIVRRDDEFELRDRFAGETIAARHYISPIRHKFWNNLRYLS